jgi:hypothetical protein
MNKQTKQQVEGAKDVIFVLAAFTSGVYHSISIKWRKGCPRNTGIGEE